MPSLSCARRSLVGHGRWNAGRRERQWSREQRTLLEADMERESCDGRRKGDEAKTTSGIIVSVSIVPMRQATEPTVWQGAAAPSRFTQARACATATAGAIICSQLTNSSVHSLVLLADNYRRYIPWDESNASLRVMNATEMSQLNLRPWLPHPKDEDALQFTWPAALISSRSWFASCHKLLARPF